MHLEERPFLIRQFSGEEQGTQGNELVMKLRIHRLDSYTQ